MTSRLRWLNDHIYAALADLSTSGKVRLLAHGVTSPDAFEPATLHQMTMGELHEIYREFRRTGVPRPLPVMDSVPPSNKAPLRNAVTVYFHRLSPNAAAWAMDPYIIAAHQGEQGPGGYHGNSAAARSPAPTQPAMMAAAAGANAAGAHGMPASAPRPATVPSSNAAAAPSFNAGSLAQQTMQQVSAAGYTGQQAANAWQQHTHIQQQQLLAPPAHPAAGSAGGLAGGAAGGAAGGLAGGAAGGAAGAAVVQQHRAFPPAAAVSVPGAPATLTLAAAPAAPPITTDLLVAHLRQLRRILLAQRPTLRGGTVLATKIFTHVETIHNGLGVYRAQITMPYPSADELAEAGDRNSGLRYKLWMIGLQEKPPGTPVNPAVGPTASTMDKLARPHDHTVLAMRPRSAPASAAAPAVAGAGRALAAAAGAGAADPAAPPFPFPLPRPAPAAAAATATTAAAAAATSSQASSVVEMVPREDRALGGIMEERPPATSLWSPHAQELYEVGVVVPFTKGQFLWVNNSKVEVQTCDLIRYQNNLKNRHTRHTPYPIVEPADVTDAIRAGHTRARQAQRDRPGAPLQDLVIEVARTHAPEEGPHWRGVLYLERYRDPEAIVDAAAGDEKEKARRQEIVTDYLIEQIKARRRLDQLLQVAGAGRGLEALAASAAASSSAAGGVGAVVVNGAGAGAGGFRAVNDGVGDSARRVRVMEPAGIVNARCGVCGTGGTSVFRCSACKLEWYCGQEHQREHWPEHRLICKEFRALGQRFRYVVADENGAASDVAAAPAAAGAAEAAATLIGAKRTADQAQLSNTRPGTGGGTGGGTDGASTLDTDGVESVESERKVALNCPLTMARMRLPVRGVRCRHLGGFDAYNFLSLAKSQLISRCATCNQSILFEELAVSDKLLQACQTLPDQHNFAQTAGDGPYVAYVDPAKRLKDHHDMSASSTSLLGVAAAAAAAAAVPSPAVVAVSPLSVPAASGAAAAGAAAAGAPLSGLVRAGPSVSGGVPVELSPPASVLGAPGGAAVPLSRSGTPAQAAAGLASGAAVTGPPIAAAATSQVAPSHSGQAPAGAAPAVSETTVIELD